MLLCNGMERRVVIIKNNITIISGHYGCGKTNLAINMAIEKANEGKDVVIVDMDIVNPYFRTGDYQDLLSKYNIKIIAPSLLGTTTDTPAISAMVNFAFVDSGKEVIIDLGGDDAGATAIGSFREKITDYTMIYVINQNRMQSSDVDGALNLLKEIEFASKLKATAVVNNTHLGVETTRETVLKSIEFAKDFCEKANLPLLYSTAPDFAQCDECKIVKRYVSFPWECDL